MTAKGHGCSVDHEAWHDPFCGDTNRVAVDTETQLIDQWQMTAVNVHDRRMLESVLAVKPAGDSQL